MKKLFTFFSMLLCTHLCIAQNTLNIHQKDGTTVSYAFAEKPVVTYTENGIHLKTTKVEILYLMTYIEKFTFSDNESNAVETLKTENTDEDVRIYGINGVLQKTIKQSEGSASFSITDLPKGAYIIKNGGCTYKIIKK